MKRYLLFIFIFSNLSFSQDITQEGISAIYEEALKEEDNLKTLVCSGTVDVIYYINNKFVPSEEESDSITEYVYLGSSNVFIREFGLLDVLGQFRNGRWDGVLPYESFNLNDASINYSSIRDEDYYNQNPDSAKGKAGLYRIYRSESVIIDRYTGKFSHIHEQKFKDDDGLTSERKDKLEGMCKLAGKKQF